MTVDFDENTVSEQAIFEAVKSLGYGIYHEGEQPKGKEVAQDKRLFVCFIISLCILIPLLYVSMGHMVSFPLGALSPERNPQWFAFYQCILTAAVIGVNFRFFTSGVKALIKKVPNMDTLVALGAGVSFLYSFVMMILIFVHAGEDVAHGYAMNLYFESAATILTLVTVGKWLRKNQNAARAARLKNFCALRLTRLQRKWTENLSKYPSRRLR